jgi:Large extracellular alpha-helical protein
MKKTVFIIAVAAAVAASLAFSLQAYMKTDKTVKDKEGHVLSGLWQEYASALGADRPQKMEKILTQIKQEAVSRRLHWDFYDASVRLVDDVASRNWKRREAMRDSLVAEFAAYGEPIVSYAASVQGYGAPIDIEANKSRLLAGRNDAFYSLLNLCDEMAALMPQGLNDDYEYVLWDQVADKGKWKTEDVERKQLYEKLGGREPFVSYLDFKSQTARKDDEELRKACSSFASAHKGEAVRLFALKALLSSQMDSLVNREGKSEDYKKLHSAIVSAEKERSSFTTGLDGKLAKQFTFFGHLREQLESKEIQVSFKSDTAVILLRNVKSLDVVLTPEKKDAKPVFRKSFQNVGGSFYAFDTLEVPMPSVDDGDYRLAASSGKIRDERNYCPRSLSIACREDAESMKFFVADCESGKPVEKVDLELFISGKSVAKAEGVVMDGFTEVPKAIWTALKKESVYYLCASYRDSDGLLHKSPGTHHYGAYREPSNSSKDGGYCGIFTDKGAYNPGETLKFKAVLYRGGVSGMHVVDAGTKVDATLRNPEGKDVGTLSLSANEYGSVAGEFLLPEGERNGSYYLRVSSGSISAGTSVVVDEFILPTYDLEFTKTDAMYFAGDTVEIGGIIKSYSGHSLGAARVSYSVTSSAKTVKDGTLTPAADGSFSLSFPARGGEQVCIYRVTVKVTDGTGETKEFSRSVVIQEKLYISGGLENASKAEVRLSAKDWGGLKVVSGEIAKVKFEIKNFDNQVVPLGVDYEVRSSDGKYSRKGEAKSGEVADVALPFPGEYSIKATARVERKDEAEISAEKEIKFIRLDDDASVLDASVENVFKLVGPCADGTLKKGEQVRLQIAAGDGPAWIIVELFGDCRQRLDRRLVRLEGRAHEAGSLEEVVFDYLPEYPDGLFLNAFYFRKGHDFSYGKVFRREKEENNLKLEFSRLREENLPGSHCTVVLDSESGVEAVASVFDKSSESIARNTWQRAVRPELGVGRVYITAENGRIGDPDVYYGAPYFKVRGLTKSMAAVNRSAAVGADAVAESEEAIPFQLAAAAPMADEAGVMVRGAVASGEEFDFDGPVRSDFATSLAFESSLRPDADGRIVLEFDASDKLSTFIVQVYAHDKTMRDALVRGEMRVTVPVKVEVAAPEYLFRGDRYVLHATVSNNSDTEIVGTAALQAYSSENYEDTKPYSSASRKVTVPARGAAEVEFDVDPKDFGMLGLKVLFADKAKTFSDAVFVTVPLHEASQTLTEAHSAVLLAGDDRNVVLKRLQSEFTGTTWKGAEYSEIDILSMVKDAIPSKVDPMGKDVLSLTEAFYVRRVASKLGVEAESAVSDSDLIASILACRNADGGFGWFEGMKSSASLTAVVLERLARLRDAEIGAEDFDAAASVRFLDRSQFLRPASVPYWCGFLSAAQYCYVRSLYASVPFEVERETAGERADFKKHFKEFKSYVADYLVPSAKDGRGLNGRILDKARRLRTLANLVSTKDGLALASAWGVRFGASDKLAKSLAADAVSLVEYAVKHVDGGWYYPDAVMPFRGLLESEAYAHSMLCDLMSMDIVKETGAGSGVGSGSGASLEGLPSPAAVADGIRLWLMLQKETQKWDEDPAFVDALSSILSGSEAVLSTKVVRMTKTYRKPIVDIASAGNGFTIERSFFRETTGPDSRVSREELKPGALLHVGDKVVAEYKVWSQENRSFVKLTAAREAAFRPVDQLSGHVGWWASPLRVSAGWVLSPQGYRNVKTECTEYFFDVYPEEKSTVNEEFFVTQEGKFRAPVVKVESLYAPHYRANAGFEGAVSVAR